MTQIRHARRSSSSSLSLSLSSPSSPSKFRPKPRSRSRLLTIDRRTIQITACLILATLLSTITMVLYLMPQHTELKDTLQQQGFGFQRRFRNANNDGGSGSGNNSGNGNHLRDLDDIEVQHEKYMHEQHELKHEHKHEHEQDGHDHRANRHLHHHYKEGQLDKQSKSSKHSNKQKEKHPSPTSTSTSTIEADIPKLFPFTQNMNEETKHELKTYVESIRNPYYETNEKVSSTIPYDIYDCPSIPPKNYPYEYPLLDILHNWNPNNTTLAFEFESGSESGSESTNSNSERKRPKIYSSICRFHYDKDGDIQKALNYRIAEVPFILRDDPNLLQVVKRWNTPKYLSNLLTNNSKKNGNSHDGKYKAEYSTTNHLMFFREKGKTNSKHRNTNKLLKDWKPPMSEVYMTYDEWVDKASQPIEEMGPDKPHYYFRVNAKSPRRDSKRDFDSSIHKKKDKENQHFMFDELPFFQSKENFYIVDDTQTRGINCRFGMNGNIAEAHFDGSRNFVMLFGGERRYVLSHPKQCPNLALYPSYHPSGRHSALDWSDPDLNAYPEFKNAQANEVVLQAGDALYLPTQWFHFIISLNLNWQCNARSGVTQHYFRHIKDCGF